MNDALQRGSVVLRSGRYGVVWGAGPEPVLLPIARPAWRQRAHDVELSFAELLESGIAMPTALVRCGQPAVVELDGLERVGMLSGAVLCRLTFAAIRAYQDARTEARWTDDRRHRAAARDQPVNLVR